MKTRFLTNWGILAATLAVVVCLHPAATSAQPTPLSCAIISPVSGTTVSNPTDFVALVNGGTPPYTYRWVFAGGTPSSFRLATFLARSNATSTFSDGPHSVILTVTDAAAQRATFRIAVVVPAPITDTPVSINSTSANRQTLPSAPVPRQRRRGTGDFAVVAVNDLGMHCGDLDHRIASILPPFNVVRAQVIKKASVPAIIFNDQIDVFYSAASNRKDPALVKTPRAPVVKTNFWELNPQLTGNSLAFDAYDPFYPPNILSQFPLTTDMGLPAPDVERLFIGGGALVADQQNMPGQAAPYVANDPQRFNRFFTIFPFFVNFPFGYTLDGVNLFAAEGIPITPFDDFGRKNPYPLMRVQARAGVSNAFGITPGTLLAAVDTVVPVSAEANCYKCHTSSRDGGNGRAACIPGVDVSCPQEGSPRGRGTPFNVATSNQDPDLNPSEVSREWAADLNILRLHDAKHFTTLTASTPVVCQKCHYTPALDLAHAGPMGPDDAQANGREQRIHQTNSRVIHSFHGRMTDLFPKNMPRPDDPRRLDPVTGKPVINRFVENRLNRTCYQCHPGEDTKCLRGAMFNGGLVCHDCHGNMLQVGNDFSVNFSAATPFPAGANLRRRIPWATEPGCQSCHTGDAVSNLGQTDPNVIRSRDGIRLLQAYRTNDRRAKPIVAVNRRFAENRADRNQVLYRFSKDEIMGGVFCQACHGGTHAEWPVRPAKGRTIANDNVTSFQLQGHAERLTECTVCHLPNTLTVSLGGPHGMHAIEQLWVDGHGPFTRTSGLNRCQPCHGRRGRGTVLSRTAADRTFQLPESSITLPKRRKVTCDACHPNFLLVGLPAQPRLSSRGGH